MENMVYCRGCGKQIYESDSFCPHCGKAQKIENTSVNTNVNQNVNYGKNVNTNPNVGGMSQKKG